MSNPTLVIMAAGMGSRYGGLKQMDPMDEQGNVIIDYSLYDAHRAGFNDVIFVTKEADLDLFKSTIGKRAESFLNVKYAIQDISDIPKGFTVPKERIKPWGTAHAIYACRHLIEGPFAVINADDYYGIEGFSSIYGFLSDENHDSNYVMVGYYLKNTLSENGHVARGICKLNNDTLSSITERTHIERVNNEIGYYSEDKWFPLPENTIVSMNMWGFSKDILEEIEKGFSVFLENNLKTNPLSCEYYLPSVVENVLAKGIHQVKVLISEDKWYGVTYKEDKPAVVEAFKTMHKNGLYPPNLSY